MQIWSHHPPFPHPPPLDQRSSIIVYCSWDKDQNLTGRTWPDTWFGPGLQSCVSHTRPSPMSSHTGLLLVHLFRGISISQSLFLEHFSFCSLSSYLLIIHHLALSGLSLASLPSLPVEARSSHWMFSFFKARIWICHYSFSSATIWFLSTYPSGMLEHKLHGEKAMPLCHFLPCIQHTMLCTIVGTK